MEHLILIIFVLNLLVYLINTVGADTIAEYAWKLYNLFPTSTSTAFKKQGDLQVKFMNVERELKSISAQDQFSSWARVRRNRDKIEKEYLAQKSLLENSKSTFISRINKLRWISTNGARFGLQMWYSRQAMFWIPRSILPGFAEWMLSFPKAPTGSVSIHVWGMACSTVITLVGDSIVLFVRKTLAPKQDAPSKEEKAAPITNPLSSTNEWEKKTSSSGDSQNVNPVAEMHIPEAVTSGLELD